MPKPIEMATTNRLKRLCEKSTLVRMRAPVAATMPNITRPTPPSIAQHFIFRQFGQEKRFCVARHGTAVDDARPQIDGRRCDEGGAQCHDLEIVVQVLPLTTIERPTGGARVALSVIAN